MLEGKVEKKVVKWARARDILAWKLNVLGMRGVPDRLFIFPPGSRERIVFIEFKRDKGGRIAPLQARMKKLLAERGIPCYIENHADSAIEILREYL